MNKPNFTKGPWYLLLSESKIISDQITDYGYRTTVVDLNAAMGGNDSDAQLIADAPTMFEMIKADAKEFALELGTRSELVQNRIKFIKRYEPDFDIWE